MAAGPDLQGPVGYDGRWVVFALAALLLVAAYYATVLWWTRPRPLPPTRVAGPEAALRRLDEIGADVGSGRLTARRGHQAISVAVRSFVAARSGVPAEAMTLADFRRQGPEPVAELLQVLYPPAFGPDDGAAHEEFDAVLEVARRLVTSWV